MLVDSYKEKHYKHFLLDNFVDMFVLVGHFCYEDYCVAYYFFAVVGSYYGAIDY